VGVLKNWSAEILIGKHEEGFGDRTRQVDSQVMDGDSPYWQDADFVMKQSTIQLRSHSQFLAAS
jgi:hypothetical protein